MEPDDEYEKTTCPECGSDDLDFVYAGGSDELTCNNCGFFEDPYS